MAGRTLHGVGGEWWSRSRGSSWPILDAFARAAAAAEVGIPKTDDFNRGNNEGCGYFHVNQRRGVRWSGRQGLLEARVRRRPNLIVVTAPARPQARRPATGVDYVENGLSRNRWLPAEVIHPRRRLDRLAAALLLAGIGPAGHLREQEIEVRHALDGAGNNLQTICDPHRLQGRERRGPNERRASLAGKARMALEYALHRRGPRAWRPSPTLGAFARTDLSFATPNVEYQGPATEPRPLRRAPASLPGDHRLGLQPGRPAVAQSGSGPGTRQHRRRSPPAIWRPRSDRKVAADAIRLTRTIMAALPALAPYAPEEHLLGPAVATEAELVQAAGALAPPSSTPSAIRRMGLAEDGTAVVDARAAGARNRRASGWSTPDHADHNLGQHQPRRW
ncbi:MAG: GMC family oxidoreductase N-terminal domain-containing protein [Geminicoccaceae bacterium]